MKIFVVLLAVFASISSIPIAQFDDATFERQLRSVIERQRQNFPCGWPDAGENGIDPVDPLFVPEVIIETRGIGTRLTSVLTNINLVGLRNFVIQRLQVNTAARTISYRFSVAQMSLTGSHDTRGSMIGISVVTGNGPMTATMTNSWVEGILHWHTLPGSGYMQFHDQTTAIDSQNVVVRMEGFGLITNTVNRQINDLIPEMLADPEFQQEINEILNSIMLPLFNDFMYHMTPEEVAALLDEQYNNPPPQRCFW
ncbi:hypothetical protein PVAND_007353 [Polypedilum vanderplanki]|uniref:Hemolymph juvenile hormone binding protein n=1 Tax=Polypedilum vanderplanki TaxID=319348 RepID=A0A9J6C692_POLVA|nr:hypothetical protein PVAND_007353 [Polypedilum vanderplanki]